MSQGEVSDTDNEVVLSNFEKSKAIDALVIGSGADLFREFENKFSNFCPFEAIGMVHQEIRHAHFLSFVLDPNRPHPFKDHLLKGFLQEILAQAQDGQINIQPLAIHCSDFSGALVYRERSNIDFMIEIPSNAFGSEAKSLVVTVELKVGASESKHQLTKYYDQITADYPDKEWERAFVFLTLDATMPTEENSKSWIPVSIVDVINRLDLELKAQKYSGEAVELFRSYSAMIRRHLVNDEEMARLAKNIWGKHREALEALYEYRPDLQAEIVDWIRDNPDELSQAVKKATGFNLVPDTSSTRLLRFAVSDWAALNGFQDGDTKWVKSGSLMVLELTDRGDGRLRFSFVLGPGDADVRQKIYDKVLEKVDAGEIKIGRRTSELKNWKHFSAADVQTDKEYSKAEESEVTAEELGRKIMKKMAAFLELHLPVYDNLLRETFK
ncbi:PD-(D/E)XK nuclease family protein [Roseovarius mucosus]|uniref:PD-(D/E)XK nuclease family protein n=1 Tax=Roseovarius mucosus TaxID=215743 RepID=UPI001C5D34AB|nr:PD-(D/E)XK nuclease family protein [Roseovarius mucosus]MBW4975107.1 PD-(D/E)XK nuclease family protein [Roseovarius mucosus]